MVSLKRNKLIMIAPWGGHRFLTYDDSDTINDHIQSLVCSISSSKGSKIVLNISDAL